MPKIPDEAPPFILDQLHEHAKQSITTDTTDRAQRDGLEGYDFDAVELLCSHDKVAMSEFDIIQLVFR